MEIVFLTFILVLSVFLGFELISKVPATLHTPLMSGANAISGITLAGAFLAAGTTSNEMASWLGGAAVAFATSSTLSKALARISAIAASLAAAFSAIFASASLIAA